MKQDVCYGKNVVDIIMIHPWRVYTVIDTISQKIISNNKYTLQYTTRFLHYLLHHCNLIPRGSLARYCVLMLC